MHLTYTVELEKIDLRVRKSWEPMCLGVSRQPFITRTQSVSSHHPNVVKSKGYHTECEAKVKSSMTDRTVRYPPVVRNPPRGGMKRVPCAEDDGEEDIAE